MGHGKAVEGGPPSSQESVASQCVFTEPGDLNCLLLFFPVSQSGLWGGEGLLEA